MTAPRFTPLRPVSAKRRLADRAWRFLSYLAVLAMTAVLGLLGYRGRGIPPRLALGRIIGDPARRTGGGLANAIAGTLWLGGLTVVLVVVIGVEVATYDRVYGSRVTRSLLMF